MILQYTLTTTLVLILVSCKNKGNTSSPPFTSINLQETAWLLGKWQNSTEEGEATEIWNKQNDSTYVAESFIISEEDTAFHETIRMEQRNNQLHYIVRTAGQNNLNEVTFTLTSATADVLVFENPKHDFPTKITYTKIGQDSLYAEISGVDDGEIKREGFPFKKINQQSSSNGAYPLGNYR